jgi:secondary thiamine-phosphate synthase enzyme
LILYFYENNTKRVYSKTKNRGFHLITDEILQNLKEISSFKIATLNLFLKHSSASLTINENCDASVRADMENYVNDVISNKSYFEHTYVLL